MTRENAAQDLIDMTEACKGLVTDNMSDDIVSAANDALRSLIKSMAILGYNLVNEEDHGYSG
jgi:hypothetical protein|tara:strand:- start:198 stop:383 length:186 start_codon:yes stop_codon:yes gene_type:complete